MLDLDASAAGHALPLPEDDSSHPDHDVPLRVEIPPDVSYVASLELAVVTKRRGGTDATQIKAMRNLVHDIVSGQVGPCKFLVFDFANAVPNTARPGAGFEDLITDVSDLIFQAPVVSIARVRRGIAGADLELALACSMIVGDAAATFGFGADLATCLRSYALLAHRIGFVQAERLLDGGQTLDAAAMQELLLLQAIVSGEDGPTPIAEFVKGRMRRHNSACGIYRAQRIAMLGA